MLAYQIPIDPNDEEAEVEYFASGPVIAGGDGEQMREAIRGYYDRYHTQPIVTVAYLDADGLPATQETAYTTVYKIETPTILSAPSVENIMVVPVSTFAEI